MWTSMTRSPRSVLGAPPPLELLLVQGRPVVERGRLVTVRRGRGGGRGWPPPTAGC
jgi:hypothetical protein